MVRRVLGYFETVKVGGITVMGMLSIAEYTLKARHKLGLGPYTDANSHKINGNGDMSNV